MSSLQKLLNNQRPLCVYYQSWSANWASDPANLDLTKIPSPINIVILSFVNPSCSYRKGANTWSGTGLDFSSDFGVVKGSIQLLKQKGFIVMIAVGGATYPFTTFNPQNIADLANDLGVDGVDIDWEPAGGASESAKLGPIISQMRSVLPNALLSLAGFSVGCYGRGEFASAQPGSSNTGMNIDGLQSNGKQLDFINIMSYDASNVYDPLIAFKAYRTYYSGPLLLGCEVPPEAWGGHILTLPEVESYSQCVINDPQLNGIFVWSYQKPGTPSCMDIIKTANNILQNKPINPTPFPSPTPTPPPTPVPSPVPTTENWVSGKVYTKGQIVLYNGNKYICNIDILSCSPDKNAWALVNPTPTPVPTPKPNPVPTPTPKPVPTPTPKPTPVPSIFPWSTNKSYTIGQKVTYNGCIYMCIQSHFSQIGWTPDVVPALWIIS